ncbi:FAD-dependent oxidoreductase [Gracilibacillus alcaliphilus]|uniref:FAD-dependent oxidoreductase n=1 Tax=Gracilibacillus alcaliphilus TaxID=1401441 RepID=UPI00195E75F4|nr:FAD-dependent oxidoreductase [Gracilibacillus alcaliphilus]MBM7678863.1 NADPH-dependent 2,4-dienoyl-CoA reductase/sulfur reductase-like enzyme [Gracilibacillus alcaliphilus]
MKYVIIGGVAAGMSAAMEIVRTDQAADITVLERGDVYSYGQCGLPYVINGLVPSAADVIARSVSTFRDEYGIQAEVHIDVIAIDIDKQQVTAKRVLSDELVIFDYDRLLVATGADPIIPDWSGVHLEGIHVLKTIPDTTGIMADLAETIRHVTIIGGGYIGLEAADSFRSKGLSVTIVQRGKQLAKIFDAEMAEWITAEANKNGIEVRLDEEVVRFTGTQRVKEVVTNKDTIATDLVLISAGIKPNTDFLKDTSIQRTKAGAIIVDASMQTSSQYIYAAGDCATHYHLIKQTNDYVPLGTTANKQGRIAGANMAGNRLTFKGITGTSIIKFFDLTLSRTGISEKEAKQLNIPYQAETKTANNQAGYYPGGEEMHIKLLYHRYTNHLLGVQIIGKKGVDKRIDVFATALYNQMTIDQLQDLDLAYAPPYNSVWDPLQKISRRWNRDKT